MESIVRKPQLLVNFTFVNLLEYCDVINAAQACENDYRHVIIKGQALFKEHFVKLRSGSSQSRDEMFCVQCYWSDYRHVIIRQALFKEHFVTLRSGSSQSRDEMFCVQCYWSDYRHVIIKGQALFKEHFVTLRSGSSQSRDEMFCVQCYWSD
ncbi:hypothetical protein BgiBS90_032929 [Biomphalaria glabrata]|nr:hypothetical protein BgiBS90_032929 [Biomphalaria glabrata]